MATPIRNQAHENPLKRLDVQEDFAEVARIILSRHNGTGKVVVEFDFHGWTARSWRCIAEGARKDLT